MVQANLHDRRRSGIFVQSFERIPAVQGRQAPMPRPRSWRNLFVCMILQRYRSSGAGTRKGCAFGCQYFVSTKSRFLGVSENKTRINCHVHAGFRVVPRRGLEPQTNSRTVRHVFGVCRCFPVPWCAVSEGICWQPISNPKGIVSSSPRLRVPRRSEAKAGGTRYLGSACQQRFNRNAVAANVFCRAVRPSPQPRCG